MTGLARTRLTDSFIPEPVWFARQLGWAQGWGGPWGWTRLVDAAEDRYWANRAKERAA